MTDTLTYSKEVTKVKIKLKLASNGQHGIPLFLTK